MREARPTIFLGVPRVWEKLMEGMLEKGRSVKGLKKKIGKRESRFVSLSGLFNQAPLPTHRFYGHKRSRHSYDRSNRRSLERTVMS